jgi:hypothetical protein
MANSAGTTVIYPTGWGRFALNSPDGPVLQPGHPLTVLVAGHEIEGTVHTSDLGDYLQLEDGDRCGLCACMRVMATAQEVEVVQ